MAVIYVATTGNDTTGDGSSGNPYASPGKAAGVAIAGDTIWIKAGTYTIASSTANIATGRISIGAAFYLRGYNSTIGDLTPWSANRPVIKAGVNSIAIITVSASDYSVSNIVLDGDKANRTSTTGTSGTSQGFWWGCTFQNCTGIGYGVTNAMPVLCEASACGGAGINSRSALMCVAHGMTGGANGFTTAGLGVFRQCLSYANTGVGFNIASADFALDGCVAYGNTLDGIDQGAENLAVVNSISYGNGGYGLDDNGKTTNQLINCAFGSNTPSATRNTLPTGQNLGAITLTADPFTNAAGGDFSLNNTSGGGVLLRGLGWGTLLSTIGYPDVGAAQHLQPPAGVARLINGGLIG